MRTFLMFIFSLTNFHTSNPSGDPLIASGFFPFATFERYYVSVGANAALINEFRYQYLYDSYNNTVGRQITYEKRNFYFLKPTVNLGFSFGRFTTFLYYRGDFDNNYLYEKIIYSSGYIPEDTVRIERKGDIYSGGFATFFGFGKYRVGAGLSLLNKEDIVSSARRAARPEIFFSYRGKNEGVGLSLSARAKFSEETEYTIPDKGEVFLYYSPSSRTMAKFEMNLCYLDFSRINDSYEDYIFGSVAISNTFRDKTTLKVGGILEKSFEGNYYAPGCEVGLGYIMDPAEIGILLSKMFYNYSQGGELIEESPVKVQFYLRISK